MADQHTSMLTRRSCPPLETIAGAMEAYLLDLQHVIDSCGAPRPKRAQMLLKLEHIINWFDLIQKIANDHQDALESVVDTIYEMAEDGRIDGHATGEIESAIDAELGVGWFDRAFNVAKKSFAAQAQ